MSLSAPAARQTLLRPVIKKLADAARAERAQLHFMSPEWEFYRGVERAALDVLEADRHAVRSPGWLDHETLAFRDGYLECEAGLSVAITAPDVPPTIPMPTWRPHRV